MEDTPSKVTATLDNITNSYSGDYKNRGIGFIILYQNNLIKHLNKVTQIFSWNKHIHTQANIQMGVVLMLLH